MFPIGTLLPLLMVPQLRKHAKALSHPHNADSIEGGNDNMGMVRPITTATNQIMSSAFSLQSAVHHRSKRCTENPPACGPLAPDPAAPSKSLGDAMWHALEQQQFGQVLGLGVDWLSVCNTGGWADLQALNCNVGEVSWTDEQWSKSVYAMLLALRFDEHLWDVTTRGTMYVEDGRVQLRSHLANVGSYTGFWDNTIPAHASNYTLLIDTRPIPQIDLERLQSWNTVMANLFNHFPLYCAPHPPLRYEEVAASVYNFAIFTSLAPSEALRALESGCSHLDRDVMLNQPPEILDWYGKQGPISHHQIAACRFLLEDLIIPAETQRLDLQLATEIAYPNAPFDALAGASLGNRAGSRAAKGSSAHRPATSNAHRKRSWDLGTLVGTFRESWKWIKDTWWKIFHYPKGYKSIPLDTNPLTTNQNWAPPGDPDVMESLGIEPTGTIEAHWMHTTLPDPKESPY